MIDRDRGDDRDLGVERARALGAQRHVLLNPDATMAPGALDALVAAVRDEPDVLAAPRIERPDGSTWSAGSIPRSSSSAPSSSISSGVSRRWSTATSGM